MSLSFKLCKEYEIKLRNYFNSLNKIGLNKQYSIDDFLNLANNCSFEHKIEKLDLRQIVKNTLTQMYKNNEIYRIKRNLYIFSDEIFKLKIDIDQNKFSNYVIYDLYHDYLKENTSAIPSDNQIYLIQDLFLNLKIKEIFLICFKQFKIINKNIKFKNICDKEIYKILIFLSKNKGNNNDNIQKYIIKKLNENELNVNYIESFFQKNKKYLKEDNITFNSYKLLKKMMIYESKNC